MHMRDFIGDKKVNMGPSLSDKCTPVVGDYRLQSGPGRVKMQNRSALLQTWKESSSHIRVALLVSARQASNQP
jgi:hypothetical protein